MRNLTKRALSSNVAILLITILLNGLAVRFEPVSMVDTPIYVTLADEIRRGSLSQLFSPLAPHWAKITFLSVLAAARAVSPDHWMSVILWVNLLCSGLTAAMLARIVWHGTRSYAAMTSALLFYWSGFDIVVWVRCVLTDTMYAAAALAVFAVITIDIFHPEARARFKLLLPALAAAFLTRTPGLLLIPLTAVAYLRFVRPPETRNHKTMIVSVVLIVAIGAPLARAVLVHDPALWPVDYLRPRLERLAERANNGVVVNGRPELALPAPQSVRGHVAVQAVRFVRFFQCWSADFSLAHNLIAATWFGLLYLFGLIGAFDGLRTQDWRRRSLVALCLLWIVGFSWFFALTELDFDWRYRMPVLPQFIVLAACGIEVLTRRRSSSSCLAT